MVLWRDAIKKSPNKAQVISDLGNAYFRRVPSDLNRAEQLYKWSAWADKSYFKAFHNLAIVNFKRGDDIFQKDPAQAEEYYRTSIKYFWQALDLSINPDSWNDIGTTYLRLKELEQAEKCYQQAVQVLSLIHISEPTRPY